jgi:hypothetical protein
MSRVLRHPLIWVVLAAVVVRVVVLAGVSVSLGYADTTRYVFQASGDGAQLRLGAQLQQPGVGRAGTGSPAGPGQRRAHRGRDRELGLALLAPGLVAPAAARYQELTTIQGGQFLALVLLAVAGVVWGRGGRRVGAWLLLIGGLGLLVTATATTQYVARYALPTFGFILPAAAFGLTMLARRIIAPPASGLPVAGSEDAAAAQPPGT